jgi:peptidoglycan/LPS O-acetylase OafA/YrhL
MANTAFYRKDIDGLRAIAVLSVIFFHFGCLPNGYLGVDIFFAISGYLITKIVYAEVLADKFSVVNFYLRRIRRIIPLVLFTTIVAVIVGLCVMLPDDLENLTQSVVATNFFANNILLLITTGDYWNIINEYKPLMHTWSLGIEEQFYLIYPVIFLIFSKKRSRFILSVLLVLTIASLSMFLISSNEAVKFYSIQFRFFELSLGGIGAIFFKDRVLNSTVKTFLIFVIIAILVLNIPVAAGVKLVTIVFASVLVLATEKSDGIGTVLLSNKVMTGIGMISFSLYMWHQVVLAFTRYFVLPKYNLSQAIVMAAFIFLISILSYYFIEQPFRNKKKIGNRSLVVITSLVFLLSTCGSFYLYSIGGIVKAVPELELVHNEKHQINLGSSVRNIHIQYNAKIIDLAKPFSGDSIKTRVLVIGNSFARDWTNVLLESKYGKRIEVSYVPVIEECRDLNERFSKADYIFFSELQKEQFYCICKSYVIDTAKVWNVGTKNFGLNNGIFYNKKHGTTYCHQRTEMAKGVYEKNMMLKAEWGNRYIDLIGRVIDDNKKMPVFTPECKFISQDCKHLTHDGAVYFARLLEKELVFKIK